MNPHWTEAELRRLKESLRGCRTKDEATIAAQRIRRGITATALDMVCTKKFGRTLTRILYDNINGRSEAPAAPELGPTTHDTEREMRAVRVPAVEVRRAEPAPLPKVIVQPEDFEIPVEAEGFEDLAANAPADATRALNALSEDVPTDARQSEAPLTDLERHRLVRSVSELTAARKRLVAELADKEEQISILSGLKAAPPAKIVAPQGRGEGRQRLAVPVMLLSDWHVEEPVDPESVSGLNTYNLDIADACITKCAEAFEWLVRDPRFDMRTAIVAIIGDLYSGYIHTELVESNFLSPVQAVVWLQERIERMLRRILATTDFERIIVPCNDGNHGRLTDKIRVSTRTANSLEWLLYKTLAARFQDEPRIEFHIADGEYNYIDVFDQTYCFFHGDSVRYMGGVGGLLIPMKRGLNELRKYRKVDHFAFGHFHQRIDIPEMSGNGSMIGINAYAMRLKVTPEPRQQSFFLIDDQRGKCQSTPIWL
jgi:hypothetical protein